ncbi:MAG TPA: HAMP domain-containing sensor histidine kinase [Thermoguttaceae bacterium]|nr:HAMP domain-containing sensor histidine kinase [Thermoguttaceae bacterium]
MLSNWPIRVKFLIGLGLILLSVVILAGSGLYTTYTYRSLVKGLRQRAVELPLAAELSGQVADLRISLSLLRGLRESQFPDADRDEVPARVLIVREEFRNGLEKVEETLSKYRAQLEHKARDELRIADTQREWETVHEIEQALSRIEEINRDEDWVLDDVSSVDQLSAELEQLQGLAVELPSHLHEKLSGFAAEVRSQYRALIVGTWIASVSAALLLLVFLRLFYQWVFRPLEALIAGSRRVAGGQFSYRIHLDTRDEMAELAEAMNAMTARFQAIRDDLDRQVRERTRQVVRNEQLASVGFLAAGVAHEINNPLASIAMSAESLESRVREILDEDDPQHAIIANYLRMIQNEAFRCKEITEKLLDFSRAGQGDRQNTELSELTRGVIDMIGHLGKYHQKHIEFEPSEPIVAPVNPQEMKQTVLNLLTNALDSLEEGGTVQIRLERDDGFAQLTFTDDGCGMTPEVLGHVFEPFFTRRRTGQGTGLGLSITHQIVADHGGQIRAESPGPGQGSTFQVRLPLVDERHLTDQRKEIEDRHPASPSTQTAVC